MSIKGWRAPWAPGAGWAVCLAAWLACPVARAVPARRGPIPARPAPAAALVQPGPADTLADALRRLQADPEVGGQAAFELGLLHYARGEYHQARQAFAAAQGRLEQPAHSEARYREALSWLALGDLVRARDAANPLTGLTPLQEPALVLTAQSYELEGDLVRALSYYERALDPAGRSDDPTALGRAAALYQKLGRPQRARQSYQLLVQLYPGSMEAAAARSAQASAAGLPAASGERGAISVQIGSFTDLGRARALLARARKARFAGAQLVSQGAGEAATHSVSVGVYGTREEAVEAGQRAERLLGTAYRLAGKP